MKIDRRTLLIGGGVGVGLVVAWTTWRGGLASDLAEDRTGSTFGNFLRVGRDGRVTVAVPQVETGQGAWTALPQLAADEIGAAWEQVAVEPAPLAAAYANPLAETEGWTDGLGTLRAWRLERDGAMRITAGATSVRAFDEPLRRAAAVARTMLVGAAADRWNVDEQECECADGFVFHKGQSFGFGELAEEAASRSPPSDPQPRRGAKGRLAGRPLPRLDGPAKGNGSWRFASDVRLPELRYAAVRLAPSGGRVTGYDRRAVDGMPGLRHLAARDGWIAVVADSWWQAERALHAANARFSAPASAEPRQVFDTAMKEASFHALFDRGDYESTVAGSRPLAATYYVAPSQHLALEPRSATARIAVGKAELWSASQAPALAANVAGDGAFYPMPAGEPAGRAMDQALAPIALELARVTGHAVQVTLPPSVAQSADPLSPGALIRMTALPGVGGITAAMRMDLVSSDGIARSISRLASSDAPTALGAKTFAGTVPAYGIPNLSVRGHAPPLPWASGYMRGSPERESTFATESFIDELAHAAGLEPLNLRMALLGSNFRLARCFQAASRRAGWDGGGAGSNMGIAGTSAFGSHIALVAEASIGDGQRVKVGKLTCAVDCGRIINPALVRQQVEGALIWALGQAMAAPAEWHGPVPAARKLATIGLPTIRELPPIDIVIVPSGEAPGGVNGLATLPLAPAVANAVFAATGKRMRALPFDPMAA